VLGLAKLARISSYRTLTEAANLVPSALASPGERVQGTSPSRAIGARSKANAIEPEPRSPKPLAQTVKLFGGGGFEATALGGDDKVLLDLADLRDPAELQAGWLAPIDAALRAGEIKCLHLEFASGERIVVKPAHRWRFWRRVPQARTL
jgi:hypothetical protein